MTRKTDVDFEAALQSIFDALQTDAAEQRALATLRQGLGEWSRQTQAYHNPECGLDCISAGAVRKRDSQS